MSFSLRSWLTEGSAFFIKIAHLLNPSRSEAKGEVLKFCIGTGVDVPRPSVTSFFSHISEARGLKFVMHNPHIDGSKVTDQILKV